MSYNRFRLLIISFFLLYFGIGFFTYTNKGEAYPFFTWGMFDRVPPRNQSEYSLRITMVNDKKLSDPLAPEDALGLYLKNNLPLQHYNYLIQTLGRSIEEKNQQDIAIIRQKLEEKMVPLHVSYEIDKVTYNTLQKWKTGKIAKRLILAVFLKGTK